MLTRTFGLLAAAQLLLAGQAQAQDFRFQCPPALEAFSLERPSGEDVDEDNGVHSFSCDYSRSGGEEKAYIHVGVSWVQDGISEANKITCEQLSRHIQRALSSIESMFGGTGLETQGFVSPFRKAWAWYPKSVSGARSLAEDLVSAAEKVAVPCESESTPRQRPTPHCCEYTRK